MLTHVDPTTQQWLKHKPQQVASQLLGATDMATVTAILTTAFEEIFQAGVMDCMANVKRYTVTRPRRPRSRDLRPVDRALLNNDNWVTLPDDDSSVPESNPPTPLPTQPATKRLVVTGKVNSEQVTIITDPAMQFEAVQTRRRAVEKLAQYSDPVQAEINRLNREAFGPMIYKFTGVKV